MTNLERIRKELSPARRKKVAARAAQLIAEEMTLQELRRARQLTQVRMAKALGISQDGISKLEKRSDLLLSTLQRTVEAMGGSLSLIAEFPDRGPVVLSGISEVRPDPELAGRKRTVGLRNGQRAGRRGGPVEPPMHAASRRVLPPPPPAAGNRHAKGGAPATRAER